MREALEKIRQSAEELLAKADSEAALEELRVRFLGKKGEVTAILKQMGSLSAEERPKIGALANEVRPPSTPRSARRGKSWRPGLLEQRLAAERIDVTLPGPAPGAGPSAPVSAGAGRAQGDLFGHGLRGQGGPGGGVRPLQL